MPPVQPNPTRIMSTGGSLVAMAVLLVLDALGIDRVRLVAVFGDHVGIHADGAGEADHLPHRLVAVAAIERIAEIAFHHIAVEHGEEGGARHLVELDLAALDALEDGLAL